MQDAMLRSGFALTPCPLPILGEGSFVPQFGEITLITEGKLDLMISSSVSDRIAT